MWRLNYSVTAFSHHPEHCPPSFCKTFLHCREMQEIFRSAHNNKRQYTIQHFLIRSVLGKCDHVWPSFLSRPLVLSRLTTAVVIFILTGSGSRYTIKFLIWGCITSILASNITKRWYFKLLMKPNLHWFEWATFSFPFVLQLGLWRNCDVGPTWP